jgi:hypothetical protein
MRVTLFLAVVILTSCTSLVSAQQRFVDGGQTSVLLDTATLSSVGLDLSGVSSDVIVPGELGDDSVAFNVNSRTDTPATTFAYEIFDLTPFTGTIEHMGSVFFDLNSTEIEVGDFSIGFDADRVGGDNSGFFVESTVGLEAILFDVENPTNLDAGSSELIIEANLLVSAEFADVLGNTGLTGADVGDARVAATAIPEPSGIALLSMLGLGFVARRRI